jgi:hypothetical protein
MWAHLGRKQAGVGSLFFGFFLLAKQKKETRKSRERDLFQGEQRVQIKLSEYLSP